MTKICKKCGEIKELSEFKFVKRNRDGRGGSCKICVLKQQKKWRSENIKHVREDSRKRYAENCEKGRLVCRNYYEKHRKQISERCKKNRAENIERYRSDRICRRLKNPETYKAISKRGMEKMRSTPKGKLRLNIASKISRSLKGEKCWRQWKYLVGYNIEELKAHLEKLFNRDMTWENYGTYWHVDHKIPVAAFNFEKPEDLDFKKCWALKNLQPLKAKENLIKSNKVKKPFQPSLAIEA